MFPNPQSKKRKSSPVNVEYLESRTLLSESASAQLSLVSTDTSGGTPVYHYSVSVTDTGTTNIGTFWMGWLPGEDFLPSVPTSIADPAGWSHVVTGSGTSTDGSAIQWSASSNQITPGNSLSGFAFASTDSPTVMAGTSQIPGNQGTPNLTSFIYSGAAFSDAGFRFQVTPAATIAASTTTLISSAPSAPAASAVTFTATVAPTSGTGATPTGSVTFTQDGTALGTAPVLPNGTAALTTQVLPIGTDHITAAYGGDSNYSSSASAALVQTITPPATPIGTTLTLISSQPSATTSTALDFTATVVPASIGPTPTGTVTFTLDGGTAGTSPVGAGGVAVMHFSSLAEGTHMLAASYSGDGAYAVSSSAPLQQIVTQPATLVPAITSSTLPNAAVSGAPLKGVVKLSVTNDTGALVKGKSTIIIFASPSGVIDGSSIMLAQLSKSLTVKVGKPASTSVSIKLGAGSLPAGSYVLLARLSDPSGIVNDSTVGPAIHVAPAFILLSEVLTKSSLPSTAASGAKVHGSATLSITNSGNIITPGTTTVALFVTSAGTIDGTSIQIASLSKKLKNKPGKSSKLSVALKLLPTIAPGSYTIVARVTDPNGQLSTATIGPITITA